ncbi:hypothetical protein SK128_026082 [Halocaridina rubra]|uniref:Nucleotidyl transferase domain-containing protein n=1 Tax=Halocaridina rubra TaxID=373956 RepID=A0AAN8WZT6_HALRR
MHRRFNRDRTLTTLITAQPLQFYFKNYCLSGSFWSRSTRFRPLSLDVPKPLFPVAGLPMIQHHIEACTSVPDIREILLLGYFPAQQLQQFVADMIATYKIRIR